MTSELIKIKSAGLMASGSDSLPATIVTAGAAACFAWDEFIYGTVSNLHTRRSYGYAARRFLDWADGHGLELARIAPKDVRVYLDEHLRHHKTDESLATTSKKIHLAAIRHFFDIAVTRHAVVLNPAASVRGERHQAIDGKTPEIGVKRAERLLSSVDTSTVVGLRDRAAIGVMIYTTSRVGAVAKLRRRDLYHNGEQWMLRFNEKGGKSREIPVRHDLEQFLFDYLDVAGVVSDNSPLFLSAIRRTGQLTANGMTAHDLRRMVKRRLKDVGLPKNLSPHSFRVTSITDLLSQGVPLEDAQKLAGHADARTTKLYDRSNRKITRNIVERISIRSDKASA